MFCSNCGKQAPDGAKFCTGCGSPLAAPVAPAAPAPVVEPTPAPVVEPVAEPVVAVEPTPVVEPVAEPVVVPVAPVVVEPVMEPVTPVYEAPAPAPVYEAPAPAPAPVYEAPAPVAPVQPAPAPVVAPAPKSKTPGWAIAVIIILIIALLGAAGYIVYDKVFAGDSYSDSDDDDKKDKNGKNSGGSSSGHNSSDDGSSENNPGGNTSSGSNITANNSSVPTVSSNANSMVTNRSWNAYKVLDENGNDADYPEVYYPAFYFQENGDLHALFYSESSGERQLGGSWQFVEKFYNGLYNYMFTDDDGFSFYVNYSMEDDEFTCDFGDYVIYYKDYD